MLQFSSAYSPRIVHNSHRQVDDGSELLDGHSAKNIGSYILYLAGPIRHKLLINGEGRDDEPYQPHFPLRSQGRSPH